MENAGIVTMGGGRYLPYAFCMLRTIRAKACTLPVTVFYQGPEEKPPAAIAAAMDCRFADTAPFRRRGWGAKAACLLQAGYRHVLWNDADAFWLNDGSWQFDSAEYRQQGALLWPCPAYFPRTQIWDAFGVPFRLAKRVWGAVLAVDLERHLAAVEMADRICGHPKWDYHRDTDEIGWYFAWLAAGRDHHLLDKENADLGRSCLVFDLKREPWLYHISRQAKQRIRLAFSVKESPDCQLIRGFLAEYDRLAGGQA